MPVLKLAFACLLLCLTRAGEVSMSETEWNIPTYLIGQPEINPIFYTQESYQGAQKRVYPYALQDHLTGVRTNQSYRALILENDHIKIAVLPELGGRLFEAVDKSNDYPFFYRQHVIKPALIGMLGAWISGGVEWCAFHHHRNTTFMPVDYTLTAQPDGSKTIWLGEIERRHRMKWLLGITMRPDRSYVEVTGRFFNRSPLPHPILYWANVAVHVDEHYQIIFPPSVTTATYHSKVDFTQWPVSQVRYRGVDYRGVDLSWWKNHPEPNSFFAWNLQDDFMGGYDHGRRAGVVHVADHYTVCGAKLWEWGTGPEGRRWDRILTDDDGPYAELMVGAFSDNQPDYSWILPGEVKNFTQYWYPIRDIGGFQQANLEGALNLTVRTNGNLFIGVHPTRAHASARVRLTAARQVLLETNLAIGPGHPFTAQCPLPAGVGTNDLLLSVHDAQGRTLVQHQPVAHPQAPLPQPVTPPPSPQSITNQEELLLTGLRIEQIHNPSVNPADYYQEAIRRDPGDTRAMTRLGFLALRRDDFDEAASRFRTALQRLTEGYTRPMDAEAQYGLGLALQGQTAPDPASGDRHAMDAFARATWDLSFRAPAALQLAQLQCRQSNHSGALASLDLSLSASTANTRALAFKAAMLRRLQRPADALATTAAALQLDPIDAASLNEKALALAALRDSAAETAHQLRRRIMRGEVQSYLELAADYLAFGLWDEALAVLQEPVEQKLPFAAYYPILHYYLAHLHDLKGDTNAATEAHRRASTLAPDYAFPFRPETARILRASLNRHPKDARAWYYLGNYLYEKQPDEAMRCWQKSRELDTSFATVHRNLGWAYYRHKNQLTNAVASYEKALQCNTNDPRLFLELDAVYEAANVDPARRLDQLERHHDTVARRNESLTRSIMVRVLTGDYERAQNLLENHFFHIREGGGEIRDVHVDVHLLRGLRLLEERRFGDALKHFQQAAEFPDNLSVGRPKNDRRAAQIHYLTGLAWKGLQVPDKARQSHQSVADQPETGSTPETRYYQALALIELGYRDRARRIFEDLKQTGLKQLQAGEGADFFAKFGEQESRQARTASAHYILGLAYRGLEDLPQAKTELQQAANLNRSHVWAHFHLKQLP